MASQLRILLVLLAFWGIAMRPCAQMQMGMDIDCETGGDASGWSVSMPDAFTVGIGAIRNDGGGSQSGQVRVFAWNGGAWVQKGNDIDGLAANDRIGWSVSMPDANTIGVGSGEDDGLVRVYAWDGSAWVQKGRDLLALQAYDEFGYTISMPDPNTIAVGAPCDLTFSSHSGNVRVFAWRDTSWVLKGQILYSNGVQRRFGASVSMPDSNTLAIGQPIKGFIPAPETGYVTVYRWTGAGWAIKGGAMVGDSTADHAGYDVSMPDPNTIAIAAMDNDVNGAGSGQVRILRWSGTWWVQKGPAIYGEFAGDQSGHSVSMPDSNTVAIGSYLNDGNGQNSGSVRIFGWTGSAWVQLGADIDGEAAGDQSGFDVSMPDPNRVAIGAPLNTAQGGQSGHVRVYTLVPLAAEQATPPQAFTLVPNPTSGRFALHFPVSQQELSIQVERIDGQVIHTSKHDFADKLEFDLQAAAGIYVLRVYAAGVALGNAKLVLQ